MKQLLILVFAMMAAVGFAQDVKPEENNYWVQYDDVTSEQQFEAWKAVINKNPKDENAWLNAYRWSLSGDDEFFAPENLEVIKGSYAYYYIMYMTEISELDAEYAEAALKVLPKKMTPYDYETWLRFLARDINDSRFKKMLKDYYKTGMYSKDDVALAKSLMDGMDKNAVYFVEKNSLGIGAYLVQQGMGKHKDKLVVSGYNLSKKCVTDVAGLNISEYEDDEYEILENMLQAFVSKGRPVYVDRGVLYYTDLPHDRYGLVYKLNTDTTVENQVKESARLFDNVYDLSFMTKPLEKNSNNSNNDLRISTWNTLLLFHPYLRKEYPETANRLKTILTEGYKCIEWEDDTDYSLANVEGYLNLDLNDSELCFKYGKIFENQNLIDLAADANYFDALIYKARFASEEECGEYIDKAILLMGSDVNRKKDVISVLKMSGRPNDAVKLMEEVLAVDEDAEMMYDLAEMYDDEYNDFGDQNEANKWYLKAAEAGNPKAMVNIADFYAFESNYDKAFYWNSKAAEEGEAKAMTNLGSIYLNTDYSGYDEKKAVEWYRKAVALDDADAMNHLAYCYANGTGVEKNIAMAHEIIDKALEMNPYEENYYDSKGEFYAMEGNKKKAMEYWQEAKNKGFPYDLLPSGLYEYVKENFNELPYETDFLTISLPFNYSVKNDEQNIQISSDDDYKMNIAEMDGNVVDEFYDKLLAEIKEDITDDIKYRETIKTINGKQAKAVIFESVKDEMYGNITIALFYDKSKDKSYVMYYGVDDAKTKPNYSLEDRNNSILKRINWK